MFWEKEDISLETKGDIVFARTMEPGRKLATLEFRDSELLKLLYV